MKTALTVRASDGILIGSKMTNYLLKLSGYDHGLANILSRIGRRTMKIAFSRF